MSRRKSLSCTVLRRIKNNAKRIDELEAKVEELSRAIDGMRKRKDPPDSEPVSPQLRRPLVVSESLAHVHQGL